MGFQQTMDLILVKKYKVKRQKNDGYCTNYGFGFTKKIKEIEAEKSWGLDKLWI